MKKQVYGRQLGRTKNQRLALFRGLISSLILKGEIETTLAKAKAVKPQAEKLITKAKAGTVANRRLILRFLPQRALVNRLVDEIAPLFKETGGGYLRIVRTGIRKGDRAPLAKVMFTQPVKAAETPAPVQKLAEEDTTKTEIKKAKSVTKKEEKKK